MKKLYPFLAGVTLISLGSLSSGSIAQIQSSHLKSSHPAIPQTQSTLQTSTKTTAAACPLRQEIAVTFLRSECQAVVLTEAKTYYRYYSGDNNKFGRYLTTDRYERNVDAIRNLALKQEWSNQATMMLTVTVPSGTTVYEGTVAPQEPQSCYSGGGQQSFIENTRDPNLVWSAGTPMQVETFECPANQNPQSTSLSQRP